MIKELTLIAIVALRIAYHPADADVAPFTSPASNTSTTTTPPAHVINLNGYVNQNRIILNWVVGENETADQFVVEKSSDGKNFSMAALVFGTDQPVTGKYQFYEKAGNHKVTYRIKLVNKDHRTEYSDVVVIHPNV